jgi:hypothetical protein
MIDVGKSVFGEIDKNVEIDPARVFFHKISKYNYFNPLTHLILAVISACRPVRLVCGDTSV